MKKILSFLLVVFCLSSFVFAAEISTNELLALYADLPEGATNYQDLGKGYFGTVAERRVKFKVRRF